MFDCMAASNNAPVPQAVSGFCSVPGGPGGSITDLDIVPFLYSNKFADPFSPSLIPDNVTVSLNPHTWAKVRPLIAHVMLCSPLAVALHAPTSCVCDVTVLDTASEDLQAANLLLMDSVAGVGYSYSLNEQDYNTSDSQAQTDMEATLREWCHTYSYFANHSVFLHGEAPAVRELLLCSTAQQCMHFTATFVTHYA